MNNKYKKLRSYSVSCALFITLNIVALAPAQAREMRVSSFEPAQGFYSLVLSTWVEQANERLSKGSRFKLYPGSILGAPSAQQELVKKGVADVALIVQSYSPGLFPLTSVVEVPGIAPTSKQGTNVLNSLLESGDLVDEYKDFKVIALFSTHGYRILSSKKEVRLPTDLEGMKIRTPSPYGSVLISMLGGSGVSIPAPQVYENLDRGVIGGAIWVFDAYKSFRLNEVAPQVTMTELTASPLAIVMNKSTYESLSDADKNVIDQMSGRAQSEWIANIIDQYDTDQAARFDKDPDVNLIKLTEAEEKQWATALSGSADAWLDMQKGFDKDGSVTLNKAREISLAK